MLPWRSRSFFSILMRKWEFDNITIGHIKVIWVIGDIHPAQSKFLQTVQSWNKVSTSFDTFPYLHHSVDYQWTPSRFKKMASQNEKRYSNIFQIWCHYPRWPCNELLEFNLMRLLEIALQQGFTPQGIQEDAPNAKNTHKCRFRPICTPK